jgi:hypothetical protein
VRLFLFEVSFLISKVLERSSGNFALVSVEGKENSARVLASHLASVTPVESRVSLGA